MAVSDFQLPAAEIHGNTNKAKAFRYGPPVKKMVYSTKYQRISHCSLLRKTNRRVQWKSLRLASSRVFELSWGSQLRKIFGREPGFQRVIWNRGQANDRFHPSSMINYRCKSSVEEFRESSSALALKMITTWFFGPDCTSSIRNKRLEIKII